MPAGDNRGNHPCLPEPSLLPRPSGEGCGRCFGRNGGTPRPVGSDSTMASPPPRVSSAVRVARIASVKPRATAGPNPTPAPRGAPRRRWKGSKMCSFSASGTPGPQSTTRSSTRSCRLLAEARTGMSAGLYSTAFSTMLASMRSSRPRSTATIGRVSGMSSSTLLSGMPPRAMGTTSSRSVSLISGTTVPVLRRDMSRRLPISAERRSAPSSIPSSRASRSVSDQSTSCERWEVTDALIPARACGGRG